MGYQHTAKVWHIGGIDPPAKLVLLKLADCANEKDECWPSLATIAKDTGLSKSTVCDKLNSLVLVKVITRIEGPRQSTIYRLLLDQQHCSESPDQSASRTSPPAGHVRQPDTTCPPAGHHLSASRTPPVRQPDTNHNRTTIELSLNQSEEAPAKKPKAKKDKLSEPVFDESFPYAHRQHLENWFRYKVQRREGYVPMSWAMLCKQWATKPEAELGAAVEHSISSNYSGLFPPRPQQQVNHRPKNQAFQNGDATAGKTTEQVLNF